MYTEAKSLLVAASMKLERVGLKLTTAYGIPSTRGQSDKCFKFTHDTWNQLESGY